MQKPMLLVPAAGFGLRMGSPPAKELLKRPNSSMKFIDWPITVAQQNQWPITIISRTHKLELNHYIEQFSKQSQAFQNLNLVQIESSVDWFDTLLQIENHWEEKNIIFLPDMDFRPLKVIEDLNDALDINGMAVASHQVNDPQNWGHIFETPEQKNSISFFEKPQQNFELKNRAWGLLGFRKKYGVSILKAQAESQKLQMAISVTLKCRFHELDYFADLTR